MKGGNKPELVILPSLSAYRNAEGKLFLTQKYLDGVAEHAKSWPGRVTSLVSIDDRASTDMDLTEIDLEAKDSGLELRPKNRTLLERRLLSASVVTGHLAPYELETARICHNLKVPLFFTSEYTPRTEAQIVDSNTGNPLLRLRRRFWIRNAERIRRYILTAYAAGLQCSGTPTYELYHELISNVLLFFDNRVRTADVISSADLAAKCQYLVRDRPLRLVFGGRLVPMKGVLELPRVARTLTELNVSFTLDIVGDGPLKEKLCLEIAALGNERIRIHPSMDFRSGWVPFLKKNADLFLCCHLQGDPSSTYPEVMSCGVPIVGYDNEAWAGLMRYSGAGWHSPIGDTAGLAKQIAFLHSARQLLVEAAWRSRDFAKKHCFESTFARRTAHLLEGSLSEFNL